ncbi:MAG: hypothetical protein V3U26_01845, partial [Dehalococcoidia bacterium]
MKRSRRQKAEHGRAGPEGRPQGPEGTPSPPPIPCKASIGGAEHHGQVIVTERWHPGLEEGLGDEGSEFRIVILTTPSRVRSGSIKDPRIAAWIPSQAVAEERAAYRARGVEGALAALVASQAYLQGSIYTHQGRAIATARSLVGGEAQSALQWLGAFLLNNAAQEYVNLIVGDLPSPTTPEGLEAIQIMLQEALGRLGRGVEQARAALSRLSQQLDSAPDEADQQATDRLLRVVETENPVRFAEAAREVCGGSSGLASDLEAYRRLEQLARLESEIVSVHAYLKGVSLGQADEEIGVDGISIREQLDLGELSARPHLWSSVHDMFRWFRARYATLYVN